MGLLRCFSLAFDNSRTRLEKKDVLKENFQISEKPQLKDELFSTQTKLKILFALEPKQKVGLLRCFSLAFDNSKTRLEKKDVLKKKFRISEKPQLKDELFSITRSTENSFCTGTHTTSGTPTLLFVSSRQL